MTGLTYFEIAQGQAFERCAHGAAAAAVERSQKKLSDQRTNGAARGAGAAGGGGRVARVRLFHWYALLRAADY